MKFSLVICTYMRPQSLIELLNSVEDQTVYPDEIIIVDGSRDNRTKQVLGQNNFRNLYYHMVDDKDRGLTRQRNYGIGKTADDIDVVCFLDDDIILEKTYFEELIKTYDLHKDALGVGGYIINEIKWHKVEADSYKASRGEYFYDGFKRKDGSRFVLRKRLGLDTDVPPACFPEFGHGRSVSFLPPSNKVYEVEQFMGGVSSYRKEVFDKIGFSHYFEGYGLYEDADFCFRLHKLGKQYVNTAARCEHHHHPSGRPDKFKYGKMVVLNGWYVWRVRHPNPSFKARFKWNFISWLLTAIRFLNIVTTAKPKEAFMEALGRTSGWFKLIFKKPKTANAEQV
ncbi:glycosyltransferase [Leptobacterium flavescens]|uniref:Glycosyltransferase n=1 Tax=Leptobacterium flavescens TaxID=472055 RepID=A0A6P0UJV7_9FLAO|nr:glycosyltransferase [Leptobacterium flavescens]NER12168.1 glycosyltransferase [Leptobacterium flavescens]